MEGRDDEREHVRWSLLTPFEPSQSPLPMLLLPSSKLPQTCASWLMAPLSGSATSLRCRLSRGESLAAMPVGGSAAGLRSACTELR